MAGRQNVPMVWLLGGPGVGKSTHLEEIASKYGIVAITSGELLRKEIARRTSRGRNISYVLQNSELVPTWIVLDLLKEELELHPGARGFIFEGYPRDKEQGELFEQQVGPVSAILLLDAPDEILKQRSLVKAVGAGFVNEDTINKRIQNFHISLDSIQSGYQSRVKKINTLPPPSEVAREIEYHLDLLFY
ncbi:hypothetical protein PPYR_08431 [Photinus pyralis]|uniref:Adenylate kinase active site lid domain-containing protein n=2 Tax=Photinus pyralis TaxID=7054 RepID=A0A5N4AJD3_PHOPY|nr:adenylate kinase isoenzyme 1-like [Photinus pyralis]KAB0797437.1 hypothetical protein PPYR_08431 [Photinus pyralis]